MFLKIWGTICISFPTTNSGGLSPALVRSSFTPVTVASTVDYVVLWSRHDDIPYPALMAHTIFRLFMRRFIPLSVPSLMHSSPSPSLPTPTCRLLPPHCVSSRRFLPFFIFPSVSVYIPLNCAILLLLLLLLMSIMAPTKHRL